MIIAFEKWHGCLNDFILVDISHQTEETLLNMGQANNAAYSYSLTNSGIKARLIDKAPHLCSRKGDGIGADGLLLIEAIPSNDCVQLTIVNSDGTIAKTCGNGLRCAASYFFHKNPAMASIRIVIEDDYKVVCQKTSPSSLISVDMGIPKRLTAEDLPPLQRKRFDEFTEQGLLKPERTWIWTIQNTHLVIEIDQLDHPKELLQKIGSAMQVDDGINVHLFFKQPLNSADMLRTKKEINSALSDSLVAYHYERGAGMTMGCGSGACAIYASTHLSRNPTTQTWSAIDMPGGRVYVANTMNASSLTLAGPAVHVFNGSLGIE